jgi:16S rRNA (adenine1518-N6/adenine1519-N6)-dimethyltransferase
LEPTHLSPVEMLRKYDLQAKKAWGQCFLHDRNAVRRIVDAADLQEEDRVIEIGAGLGVLTFALAARGVEVWAVERDRDLVQVLRAEFEGNDRVHIEEANALEYDYGHLGGKVKIVGNLPYNISAPIIFRLLEYRQSIFSATLMVQKEVADRLAATAGNRTYGIPSVICQHHADVRKVLNVGRGAFIPAPRVDSAVVQLTMRESPLVDIDDDFFRSVVQSSFAQRRKTLRKNLGNRFPAEHVQRALDSVGIEGRLRAESLTATQFGALAVALAAEG